MNVTFKALLLREKGALGGWRENMIAIEVEKFACKAAIFILATQN